MDYSQPAHPLPISAHTVLPVRLQLKGSYNHRKFDFTKALNCVKNISHFLQYLEQCANVLPLFKKRPRSDSISARDDTCYLNLMHLFLPKSIDVKLVMIVINDGIF